MIDPESGRPRRTGRPQPGRAQPGRAGSATWAVLAVIAAGGVLGALARYQVGRWWPTPALGFPAATLSINLLGSLVIGAFLVLVSEGVDPHPLVRPFFATGVLGGFTTFSTYALDLHTLLVHGRTGTAALYLCVTAVGAVLAASLGVFAARRILPGRST